MKNLRYVFIASALALAFTAVPARAAEESPWKFEFHGFVVGTVYLQDQVFLTGQGSGLLMAAPAPANHLPRPGVATDKSGTFVGADVRQTRPIFVISGPEALGAKPKAHLEFDLFGVPGPGALGYEQPHLRLRQAFAQLTFGNTTFDAGQHSAQLLLGMIPTTVAHITNPVTFGAGLIGWRTIGFRATHAIPMEGAKLELAAEISHGKWNDLANATAGFFPNAAPGNAPGQISLAWASSMPQIVARVKADGKAGTVGWTGWVAGSYESIDLKGFGSTVNPTGQLLQDGTRKKTIGSYAAILGGKIAVDPVNFNFQGYMGRGTAPLAGSMLQFGDIADLGYYAELGVNATKEVSIWALYGGSALDRKDLQNWGNPAGTVLNEANTGLRKDNQVIGGMLRYMSGGYALAAEYYTYTTKYLLGTLNAPAGTKSSSAYQFLVSGGYFF